MSLDPATVRRIASLARIRVEDHEVATLQAELNGILGWIEQLNEVDVEGVEPLTGAAQMALKMREDAVTDGGYPGQDAGQRAGEGGRFLRRAQGGGMTLTDLTLGAARDGLRARKFTARELTLAHLHAIEALNPRLNAYITVMHDRALHQADAADAALREARQGSSPVFRWRSRICSAPRAPAPRRGAAFLAPSCRPTRAASPPICCAMARCS